MSNVNDLISSLSSGDMSSAETHFQDLMNQKMQDAVDAKKIEVAQGMYGDYAEDEGIEVDEYEIEETDEIQGSETETE